MLLRLIVLSCFLSFFNSCTPKKEDMAYTPPTPSNFTGEELAKTYCGSCHLFPEPALLDQATWKNQVLPKMAERLGMGDFFKIMMSKTEEEMKTLMEANIYPENPMMAIEDWQKIINYYTKNGPEKPIPQAKKVAVSNKLTLFKTHLIDEDKDKLPVTTLVKFNPSDKKIYVGSRKKTITLFDANGKFQTEYNVPSPPSDINFTEQYPKILTMGIMDPNDSKKGKLISNNKIILDSLRRPVQMVFADLNQDKQQDLIICNYGNELGNLAWYEAKTMKEHILKPIAGARNVVIADLNKDNLPDILVLMAQAREGIFAFYNKGNGEFEEKTLLEFLPVYGSSYFDLVDVNADGFLDILYTNGDNADFSISPKAYHGIRIYENDGKNNFKESYFYPMFGASKAQIADFDLDGDMDIAAISFFPEKGSECFVYLENQGKNSFKPATFKEAKQGGLLVMDVADIDLDGDKDIILGSFIQNQPEKTKNKLYKVAILENTKNN